MLLEGKNALVTGGSQGIGAAASIELAREGANVCLTYRKHEAEAIKYAEEIQAMGRKALAVQCDIASFRQWAARRSPCNVISLPLPTLKKS
jgi:3-oxoacyl-[acyl-carrier protein] reductase